jgi:hypothetical protein
MTELRRADNRRARRRLAWVPDIPAGAKAWRPSSPSRERAMTGGRAGAGGARCIVAPIAGARATAKA